MKLPSPTQIKAKTKIIGTIGPASGSVQMLKQMILAGLEVARLNFSHGSREQHGEYIRNIRQAALETESLIPIMADLQGPKLRIGELPEPLALLSGDLLFLAAPGEAEGEGFIQTNFPELTAAVQPGDTIYLDDGSIELEVKKVGKGSVQCLVLQGGILTSRKGMSLPQNRINLPTLTEKDKKDLKFIMDQRLDFVALSFVSSAQDLEDLRAMIMAEGKNIPVIAKIERAAAIPGIESIIAAADMILIARGDLGVEMPVEDVPVLQKLITEKCRVMNKPVIIATQMLESMIGSARPTRAEASDVANAAFDGADAVMLSAETSVGKYPAIAVRTMKKILLQAEKNIRPVPEWKNSELNPGQLAIDLSKAACLIARESEARAILALTKSGRTARLLSRYRISAPILAFSPNDDTLSYLKLIWGVTGIKIQPVDNTDQALRLVKQISLDLGYIVKGDNIVYVAGIPLAASTEVNMIKLEKI